MTDLSAGPLYWTPEDARAQIRWLGQSAIALGEDPATLARLDELFLKGDVRAFAQTLRDYWREIGLEPPPDKCDPYTTKFVELFPTLKMVWKCWWVGWPPRKRGSQATKGDDVDLSSAFDPKDVQEPFAGLLQTMIANGLVQCGWQPEVHRNVMKVRKFVQGVCPPGAY
jgi:hypothetical protein